MATAATTTTTRTVRRVNQQNQVHVGYVPPVRPANIESRLAIQESTSPRGELDNGFAHGGRGDDTDPTTTTTTTVVNTQHPMGFVDGRCSCCPYGYHIDLDFLRYVDGLGNTASLRDLKRAHRSRRKLRHTLDAMGNNLPPDVVHSSDGSAPDRDRAAMDDDIDFSVDATLNSIDLLMRSGGQQNQSALPSLNQSAESASRGNMFRSSAEINVSSSGGGVTGGQGTGGRAESRGSVSSVSSISSAAFSGDEDPSSELACLRRQLAASLTRCRQLEQTLPLLQARVAALQDERRSRPDTRSVGTSMPRAEMRSVSCSVDNAPVSTAAAATQQASVRELHTERKTNEFEREVRTVLVPEVAAVAPPVVATRSIGVGDGEVNKASDASSSDVHIHEKELRTLIIGGTPAVDQRNVGVMCRAASRDVGVMHASEASRPPTRNVAVGVCEVGVGGDGWQLSEMDGSPSTGSSVHNTLMAIQQMNMAAFHSKHIHIKPEHVRTILEQLLKKDLHSVAVQCRPDCHDVAVAHHGGAGVNVGVGDDSIDVSVRPAFATRVVACEARPSVTNKGVTTERGVTGNVGIQVTPSSSLQQTRATNTAVLVTYPAATNTERFVQRTAETATDTATFLSTGQITHRTTNTPTVQTVDVAIDGSPVGSDRATNTVSLRVISKATSTANLESGHTASRGCSTDKVRVKQVMTNTDAPPRCVTIGCGDGRVDDGGRQQGGDIRQHSEIRTEKWSLSDSRPPRGGDSKQHADKRSSSDNRQHIVDNRELREHGDIQHQRGDTRLHSVRYQVSSGRRHSDDDDNRQIGDDLNRLEHEDSNRRQQNGRTSSSSTFEKRESRKIIDDDQIISDIIDDDDDGHEDEMMTTETSDGWVTTTVTRTTKHTSGNGGGSGSRIVTEKSRQIRGSGGRSNPTMPKSIMKQNSASTTSSSSSSEPGRVLKKEISFSEDVQGGDASSCSEESEVEDEEEETASGSGGSQSSMSYEEGSYDSRLGRVEYSCGDDETIASGTPGAHMYHQRRHEDDDARQTTFELATEVHLACNVYAQWLQDSTQITTKELNSSLSIIQQEWFKVSSNKLSDADQVEDYLSCFSAISTDLLQHIINMADANGNTALHYAVSHGNLLVVSLLLDCGDRLCDVDRANKAGYTAVMLASLAQISTTEQVAAVTRLFSLGNVDARASQAGQTALMLAVSHGRTQMAELLLAAGADVNCQDDDGSTALMCASEHGHADIVRMLLAHAGCDASLTDNDGSTALSIAMEAGHRDIGVLLYAHVNFKQGSPVLTRAKIKRKTTSYSPVGSPSPLRRL